MSTKPSKRNSIITTPKKPILQTELAQFEELLPENPRYIPRRFDPNFPQNFDYSYLVPNQEKHKRINYTNRANDPAFPQNEKTKTIRVGKNSQVIKSKSTPEPNFKKIFTQRIKNLTSKINNIGNITNENNKVSINNTISIPENTKIEDLLKIEYDVFINIITDKINIFLSSQETKLNGEYIIYRKLNILSILIILKKSNLANTIIVNNLSSEKDYNNTLVIASQFGYYDIVKELIVYKLVNCNARLNGKTALISAIENGYFAIVSFLLNNQIQNTKRTGEHSIKILKRYRANVNMVDLTTGNTPLMIAIEKGYNQIVELLLENGEIDINKENKDGFNAFQFSIMYKNIYAVKLFIKNPIKYKIVIDPSLLKDFINYCKSTFNNSLSPTSEPTIVQTAIPTSDPKIVPFAVPTYNDQIYDKIHYIIISTLGINDIAQNMLMNSINNINSINNTNGLSISSKNSKKLDNVKLKRNISSNFSGSNMFTGTNPIPIIPIPIKEKKNGTFSNSNPLTKPIDLESQYNLELLENRRREIREKLKGLAPKEFDKAVKEIHNQYELEKNVIKIRNQYEFNQNKRKKNIISQHTQLKKIKNNIKTQNKTLKSISDPSKVNKIMQNILKKQDNLKIIKEKIKSIEFDISNAEKQFLNNNSLSNITSSNSGQTSNDTIEYNENPIVNFTYSQNISTPKKSTSKAKQIGINKEQIGRFKTMANIYKRNNKIPKPKETNQTNQTSVVTKTTTETKGTKGTTGTTGTRTARTAKNVVKEFRTRIASTQIHQEVGL